MRWECRERFPRNRLQRKPLVSDPGMHHGTCVSHVSWCMSGSLTRGGGKKGSQHSGRMRNPQFYVSGKRPIRWYPGTSYPKQNASKIILGLGDGMVVLVLEETPFFHWLAPGICSCHIKSMILTSYQRLDILSISRKIILGWMPQDLGDD